MYPNITPTTTIRQADIPALLASYRLTLAPQVLRAPRETQGGGFGDQERYPHAWTVAFMVDGQWAALESARGHAREWASLDRLERWLRSLGFRQFSVQNEIDEIGEPCTGGPSIK